MIVWKWILIKFDLHHHRYIEIFRSSLSEVRASVGPKMRGGPMGGSGFNQRPSPYDRNDRFGGMNRFSNNGRNARNRGVDRDKCKFDKYHVFYIFRVHNVFQVTLNYSK